MYMGSGQLLTNLWFFTGVQPTTKQFTALVVEKQTYNYIIFSASLILCFWHVERRVALHISPYVKIAITDYWIISRCCSRRDAVQKKSVLHWCSTAEACTALCTKQCITLHSLAVQYRTEQVCMGCGALLMHYSWWLNLM